MQFDSGPCSPNHCPALCLGVMVVPGQHLAPSFWDALAHPWLVFLQDSVPDHDSLVNGCALDSLVYEFFPQYF